MMKFNTWIHLFLPLITTGSCCFGSRNSDSPPPSQAIDDIPPPITLELGNMQWKIGQSLQVSDSLKSQKIAPGIYLMEFSKKVKHTDYKYSFPSLMESWSHDSQTETGNPQFKLIIVAKSWTGWEVHEDWKEFRSQWNPSKNLTQLAILAESLLEEGLLKLLGGSIFNRWAIPVKTLYFPNEQAYHQKIAEAKSWLLQPV